MSVCCPTQSSTYEVLNDLAVASVCAGNRFRAFGQVEPTDLARILGLGHCLMSTADGVGGLVPVPEDLGRALSSLALFAVSARNSLGGGQQPLAQDRIAELGSILEGLRGIVERPPKESEATPVVFPP